MRDRRAYWRTAMNDPPPLMISTWGRSATSIPDLPSTSYVSTSWGGAVPPNPDTAGGSTRPMASQTFRSRTIDKGAPRRTLPSRSRGVFRETSGARRRRGSFCSTKGLRFGFTAHRNPTDTPSLTRWIRRFGFRWLKAVPPRSLSLNFCSLHIRKAYWNTHD